MNLGKKRNLQSPWGMEHLTLPSVGASFKKRGSCIGFFFLAAKWKRDELWLVHFRREPLSLAKKGILQPKKRTLVLYTHSPKSPGPFSQKPWPILPTSKKKVKKKIKKLQKIGSPALCQGPRLNRRVIAGRPLAHQPRHGAPFLYTMTFFFKPQPPFLGTFGQLFLIGSSNARLAQTSLQNFKHP
jgi:hypothetical protein